MATYANLNSILSHFPTIQPELQFELCEKPVAKLPENFRGKSVVIMDGPFMCLDPMGETGNHVLGNVVHAIHFRQVSKIPVVPHGYSEILNSGIVSQPKITNFKSFIDSAAEFFPGIEKAEHIGSMYTFRTVLPNLDKTDARPTIVTKHADNLISVFSGKIAACVTTARDISASLQ